jgi:sugar lactone lactonase YvrE
MAFVRASASLGILLVFLSILVAAVGASLAVADEASSSLTAEGATAIESPAMIETTPTDPEAAEELPHEGLDRVGAEELLEGVFEPEVQGPAGIFDDLEVEKFLASNVAVIPPGQRPEVVTGEEGLHALDGTAEPQASLMDSTVPLATAGKSGHPEAVDLNLERQGDSLAPVNSPIELEIPGELGEGINLPGPGVQIEPEGMVESRSASTIDGSVAFYPNVSEETDLAVSPTDGGVETMTQLRSPESPNLETYRIDMPAGASLQAQGDGAVVMRGEEVLMTVAPPTALDAEGTPVPTELSVEGDRLRIEVSPNPDSDYPILVDPLFQSFEWYAKHTTPYFYPHTGEGWELSLPRTSWAGGSAGAESVTSNTMDAFVPLGSAGLDLWRRGSMAAGEEGSWVYRVPRYGSDQKERGGALPETFISRMTTSDVAWRAEGFSSYLNPYMVMGLWGPSKGWASLYMHEGNSGHSINNLPYVYSFSNEYAVPDVKEAKVGMLATEELKNDANDELFVGATTVELSEPAASAPQFAELAGPTQWLNTAKANVNLTAKDAGLGVHAFSVSNEATGALLGSANQGWTVGCTGVASSPCPFSFKGGIPFEPASLPSGIDRLKVTAEDPVGHSVSGTAQVSVDHTSPVVTLSGTLTEQATLGSARPSYTLKVSASDGSSGAPQSGVANLKIEEYGKVLKEASPGCATENCASSIEWTMNTGEWYGSKTIEAVVTDAAGNTATKSLLVRSNATRPPYLELSGSMTEQEALGNTRPRYTLRTSSSAAIQAEDETPGIPAFISSLGSSGTGNGQFGAAGGVAVGRNGETWVADPTHGRIEEFSAGGTYMTQFGSPGSGAGQLSGAGTLAVDTSGDVWVVDTGNNRVEEFSENGTFLRQFGSKGTGAGQFTSPEGIAIDRNGNVWVADRGDGRLEEFNSKGEYLKSLGTKGTAAGQLGEPDGIAIDSKGDLWVADYGNNRVTEFNEAGTYLRQSGSEGAGNGQFLHPGAVAVDQAGHVWVGDVGNGRVEELSEYGVYMNQFGSKGSGRGQFSLARPMGIASDGLGGLWVSDPNDSRVERWVVGKPSFNLSFGSAGTGRGQFKVAGGVAVSTRFDYECLWVADPASGLIKKFNFSGSQNLQFGSLGSGAGQFSGAGTLAVDASGDVWVVDTGNNRVEEFNEGGTFIRQFGTKGTGAGQFTSPEGIAIDRNGNVWVADRGDGRLEEFNFKGEYLKSLGTKGTAAGQLGEPDGIAIDPKGDIWVADYGNNRVTEFNEAGTYLRQSGSEGSGNGQFLHPAAIATDPAGHVWVGDVGNGRVEELSETGAYMNQFGSKGSGRGQFSLARPMGIAIDKVGGLWISDPNNSRVEKWIISPSPTSISTEISVDGKKVDSAEGGCLNSECTNSHEWTLETAAYALGQHTISVTATDGVGRSTTKTVSIETQRDTQKPELHATGSLIEAPDGWVEQQQYELNATAEDSGAGVTQLKLMIDGHQNGIATQSCVAGGCPFSHSFTVNTAEYPGGSHQAELIATDGAGNTTTRDWTINVDPEGHASVTEVAATLEAADETAGANVVAPTSAVLEPEQIGTGDDPGLRVSGSNLVSTGVPDVTTMTADPEGGFSIKSPEATTGVTPVVSPSSSNLAVTNGVAAVAANVANEADSVIRPEYNGVQIAQSIRSETSPETYSWRVHLAPHQVLRLANPTQAEVAYEDGTIAFLITAEPAHDATGKPVPTALQVSGSELTVRVEIRSANFVYPIVAGEGWETSYAAPVVVQGPEDETQIREREEREQREREEREKIEREGGEAEGPVPPPPASPLSRTQAERLTQFRQTPLSGVEPAPMPPPGSATASDLRKFTVKENYTCQIDHCAIYKVYLRNPSYERGYNWVRWEPGTEVHCGGSQSPLYVAIAIVNQEGCGFTGPSKPYKEEDQHLTIYGRWSVSALAVSDLVQEVFTNYPALQIWVWPNGYQQPIVKHWSPGVQE